MADRGASRNSKSRDGHRASSSRATSRTGQGANSGRPSSAKNDFLSKEEEYKRLNAELEKRTAHLVKEAEAVINHSDSTLGNSSSGKPSSGLLGNVSSDFIARWQDDYDDDDDDEVLRSSSKPPRPAVGHKAPSATSIRPPRPPSGVARSRSNMAATASSVSEGILTDYNDLQSAVEEIESRVEDDSEVIEDILPSAAQDMGPEAQMRFLKAKARVMQEELDRLSAELAVEIEAKNKLIIKHKELEDERNKLARQNSQQLTQLDKHKRAAEDSRNKADSLHTELNALKKDYDTLKRSQKQQVATQSAADVRLNRALEEIEKYKSQLSQTKQQNKSSHEGDKEKIERLIAENKRLEKQKSELITGFKKQLKLIDILKRQKMHIEAAKLLSFTEDEFVKALEWGN